MANYKPYDKYKNSGIPWLGEIPEHWEVKRARRVFNERSVKGFPNEPLLAATQTKGVVLKSKYENRTVVAQNNLETLKLVEEGDFVISLRSFQGGIELAYDRGIISPAYTVLRLKNEYKTGYFKYLLKSKQYIDSLTLLVTGIREGQNIDTSKFKESLLFTPSINEQTAIARFLDYKLAKINRFIRKKKQLIQLLNEQKAAIINQAVTKGLDPKVKMKDSGIEWLGEIPEHWEVRKLKYVAKIYPSNIDKHSREGEKTVRLCNYTDVYKNDYITNDMDLMVATASDEQIARFTLLPNDVIITKDSETANDIAVPAVVKEELDNVVCGYHLSVMRPNEKILGEFLFRILQAKVINIQFEVNANGVTRVGLGTYFQRNPKIPLPPIDEQHKIIKFILKETQTITTTISKIEKELALTEEYKTALIAEAVTGKMDVRGIELPEITEEESDEEIVENNTAAEDAETYQTIEE
jgi:type I restriction enzyme S subunit